MVDKKPGNAEIESLVVALRDRDGMKREHARERLVSFGPSATPFLVPLLSDRASQTRWEAAKALSEIADPASIAALLRALEDDDNDVSWLAAEGLASIGPPVAAPLMQTIIDRLKLVEIRQGAHHVLGELRKSEMGDKIAEVYNALDCGHPDTEIIGAAERALASLKSVG
jgi:HEAT repeat protein